MSVPKWKKVHRRNGEATLCRLKPVAAPVNETVFTDRDEETDCARCLLELKRAEQMAKGVKVCSGCREEKSRDDFDVNKLAMDGKHCYCKLCRKETNHEKYLAKKLLILDEPSGES